MIKSKSFNWSEVLLTLKDTDILTESINSSSQKFLMARDLWWSKGSLNTSDLQFL